MTSTLYGPYYGIATETQSGMVSVSSQTFAGDKTFKGICTFGAVSPGDATVTHVFNGQTVVIDNRDSVGGVQAGINLNLLGIPKWQVGFDNSLGDDTFYIFSAVVGNAGYRAQCTPAGAFRFGAPNLAANHLFQGGLSISTYGATENAISSDSGTIGGNATYQITPNMGVLIIMCTSVGSAGIFMVGGPLNIVTKIGGSASFITTLPVDNSNNTGVYYSAPNYFIKNGAATSRAYTFFFFSPTSGRLTAFPDS
jgi:hypothetical protein